MPDEYQGIDSMPDKHQGIDSMNLEIEQNRIIDFIRNEIRKAGVGGAVIGISGGIDSALAATLTVKALGKDKVLGIHMPESSLTPSEDSKDAKLLQTGWELSFRLLTFQELSQLSWLQSLKVNLQTVSPWAT
jgi:NAD+ synthase